MKMFFLHFFFFNFLFALIKLASFSYTHERQKKCEGEKNASKVFSLLSVVSVEKLSKIKKRKEKNLLFEDH